MTVEPSERDILRVSQKPVQHSNNGYGDSWLYAGRWYPYDPLVPGALRTYRRDNFLGPALAGCFWLGGAVLGGWAGGNLTGGIAFGVAAMAVYTGLGFYATTPRGAQASDFSVAAD